MLKRIAHLLGFRKKDEALEKRFARMKQRYGGTEREDLDPVSHMRSSLEAPWVVGAAPQTLGEVHRVFLDKYTKGISAEVQGELVGSAH
jgi:hypothetical protein